MARSSSEELEDGFGSSGVEGKDGFLVDGVEDGCGSSGVEGKDGCGSTGVEGKDGFLVDGVEDGCGSSRVEGKDGFLDGVEDGFLKKKKKRNVKGEQWRDPLVVIGADIMLMILSCLDACSVAHSLLVSRGWRAVASSDKIWNSKCEELWHGKAHLPRVGKVNGLSKLAAYSLSVMDGKRKRVTKEDLCDHVWEFHVTEALFTHINHAWLKVFNQLETVCLVMYPAAPEYWRMLDPYWNGTGPLLRRYFHPDGSQTAEPHDRIWGGHESCYSIVTSVLADGKIRQHYVRINRWPPMYVTRKEDWSWEISNKLYFYRSIPDADKEDGTGPLFLLY